MYNITIRRIQMKKKKTVNGQEFGYENFDKTLEPDYRNQQNYNPQAYQNQNLYYAQSQQTQSGIVCPKCGSNQLQAVSDVKGKGASACKLCLCGVFGLCGTGKTKTTHYWVCQNCGHKFKM